MTPSEAVNPVSILRFQSAARLSPTLRSGRLNDIQERIDILANNADRVSYQPMNVNYKPGTGINPNAGDTMTYIYNRGPDLPGWPGDVNERNACYRHLMEAFGAPDLPEDPDAFVVTSLYCCNYFAVSRDMVRRIPFEVWLSTYNDLIVNGGAVWFCFHQIPAMELTRFSHRKPPPASPPPSSGFGSHSFSFTFSCTE